MSYSEEEPHIKNRRTFFVLLGAGVLVLIAIYTVMGAFGIAPNIGMRQSNDESLPGSTKVYLMHENIPTTVFWVGEDADASNDFIHNRSSAWLEDWVTSYGGIDDANDRCDYKPCGFDPKENAFYFALPFNDYNENGRKPGSDLKAIPWYDGSTKEKESLLKNRWIEINFNGKSAYAQWEDVGPFGESDTKYVFGDARPKERRAGLDISPAVANFLGIDGKDTTSWRFVNEADVPDGPWKEIITRSGPDF